jgi:DNA polymerase III sliding clamp (beta) subunit (PCNA family)
MEIELKESLESILKVAKDKPILIQVRENKLYVGTYGDFYKAIYEIPVLQDNFKAVVSVDMAKELPAIISNDFKISEDYIFFRSRSGSTTKITLLKEDISLPMLAKGYEKNAKAEFLGSDMKNAFFYVRHASNDKTIGDVVMKGAHFLVTPSASEVMASNGAMLSLARLHQKNPDFNSSQLLLLNAEFFNVIKVLGDDTVTLGFNDNSVSLTYINGLGTIRIISSLLNGKNPLPYSSVIESAKIKNNIKFVLKKNELLEAVRQVKIFSDDRITISVYNTGEFELFSSGARGEAKRSVSVLSSTNKEDRNLSIDVNAEYLNSYLSSNKADMISVSFSDEVSPILFEVDIGIEILAPLRKAE